MTRDRFFKTTQTDASGTYRVRNLPIGYDYSISAKSARYYSNRAFFDPQEDVSSTSNYNIEHRFTATATWRKALFGNYLTTVSLYGQANS
ncbi:MAG: hypothetical protein WD071_03535 [Pseudohongiella sp.]|uniref:hypothetical protein n=1 Tax=Pseudohongiella sp. TaxID=1979412 RepID=UPI0034A07485